MQLSCISHHLFVADAMTPKCDTASATTMMT